MAFTEEREWWEMRIRYPFVGDLQFKLNRFQEKLIANGEPIFFVPSNCQESLCESIFGMSSRVSGFL